MTQKTIDTGATNAMFTNNIQLCADSVAERRTAAKSAARFMPAARVGLLSVGAAEAANAIVGRADAIPSSITTHIVTIGGNVAAKTGGGGGGASSFAGGAGNSLTLNVHPGVFVNGVFHPEVLAREIAEDKAGVVRKVVLSGFTPNVHPGIYDSAGNFNATAYHMYYPDPASSALGNTTVAAKDAASGLATHVQTQISSASNSTANLTSTVHTQVAHAASQVTANVGTVQQHLLANNVSFTSLASKVQGVSRALNGTRDSIAPNAGAVQQQSARSLLDGLWGHLSSLKQQIASSVHSINLSGLSQKVQSLYHSFTSMFNFHLPSFGGSSVANAHSSFSGLQSYSFGIHDLPRALSGVASSGMQHASSAQLYANHLPTELQMLIGAAVVGTVGAVATLLYLGRK
jgi:hypothetical protein